MRSLIQQQLDNLQEEKTLLMQERDKYKEQRDAVAEIAEEMCKDYRQLMNGFTNREMAYATVETAENVLCDLNIEIGGGE